MSCLSDVCTFLVKFRLVKQMWGWSPWGYPLTLGLLSSTLDEAFQGVLVVTLSLCLSLDGVVYPRDQPGFGPASVRNALNAPSDG